MAEELLDPPGKKRRIIHWNPDAGREAVQTRWTWKRILAWSVGGFFGLLFAAGLVIRTIKWIAGPDVFKPHAEVAVAGAETPEQVGTVFVSQSKAELLHETAAKQLASLRRMPQDHPVQLQQLILIEKGYVDAETLLRDHEWAKSYMAFEAVNKDMDTFAANVKAKAEATSAKDGILMRIKDLEPARELAPGKLEAAFEAAGAARKLLDEGNFLGAKKLYDQGFADLKAAETAMDDYVKQNLLKGQQALTKGDRDGATKAFNAALEKSPGNDIANAGLKRAENINRVFALILQGETYEKQAQYGQAADAYRKAFALDKESASAQAGQFRAERLEKETKFNTAFNAAQAAFKAKDWATTITECQNALKVEPAKADVQAMLKSARDNEHKDAVQKNLDKGFAYENEHQWKEARDAYNETLKLQPDHTEAKEGLIRTGNMIRALIQYDRLVEAAQQLAANAEFQAAIRRFNDAMAVKPAYLVNDDKVTQLHTMLMQQNQPVEVTFKSDGKTSVWITNFRMLGQLESTTLKILPGDYQVRGVRKGYQDVIMTLVVRNGTPPPTVNVVCSFSTSKN